MGIPAEDYDIQNNFGETDHIIDLFGEIDREYNYLTRQDKTRQDKRVRFYRPLSRPYYCFFSLYSFLRCENNDIQGSAYCTKKMEFKKNNAIKY